MASPYYYQQKAFEKIDHAFASQLPIKVVDDKAYADVLKLKLSSMSLEQFECQKRNHGLQYACGSLGAQWKRSQLAIVFCRYIKEMRGPKYYYEVFNLNERDISYEHFFAYYEGCLDKYEEFKKDNDETCAFIECAIENAKKEQGLVNPANEDFNRIDEYTVKEYNTALELSKHEDKYLCYLIIFENAKKENIYIKPLSDPPQYIIRLGEIRFAREKLQRIMFNELGFEIATIQKRDFCYGVVSSVQGEDEIIICGWVLKSTEQEEELKKHGFRLTRLTSRLFKEFSFNFWLQARAIIN